MAYSILNADGSTLTILVDGSVDKFSTSLDLVGKNVAGYGQYINNNFIRLLENFSSDANNSPRSPVVGQLWYDKTNGRLKIYGNTGFQSVSGALVSSSKPPLLTSGDMWWDSTNNQLNIFNYQQAFLIGPSFPKSVGSAGWTMPSGTIVTTNSSDSQEVILLENYGKAVGALSNSEFTLTTDDATNYFNLNTTTTLVSGLTILGDIKSTGRVTNNYLSTHVNYYWLDTSGVDWTIRVYYDRQNKKICDILSTMFPTVSNTLTNEVGVLMGSDAKVFCYFAEPGQTPPYHVRRFKVVNKSGVGISWQPYEIYPNSGINLVSGTGNINLVPFVNS